MDGDYIWRRWQIQIMTIYWSDKWCILQLGGDLKKINTGLFSINICHSDSFLIERYDIQVWWLYIMVADISCDISFDIWYLGCKGIPHVHVLCFLAMQYAFFTMWYHMCFFQNHRKLQLRIIKDQKWLKIFVWRIGSHSTHWEPCCTTLNLWSLVTLLEYGSTHLKIICCSLNILRGICYV